VAHETHARVAWPALLVPVANDILEVWIRLLSEETLNQITRVVRAEAEEDPDSVNVACVQTDWVLGLCGTITELQEVVGALRWSSHFARALQAQKKQIDDQTIVLEDERGKLQTSDHTIAVNVVHVLVVQLNVVLGRDVVCQVVVHDQAEQSV
jgi:hypothetical protein